VKGDEIGKAEIMIATAHKIVLAVDKEYLNIVFLLAALQPN